jgi:DNA-binding Lrp family transcriptional regulator
VNLRILEFARRHPQSSVADIGRGVGLERDTTQKRINKLSDLGALQRRVDVNLDALGFVNRYLMDIMVDHKELKHPSNLKALGRRSIVNPQERLALKILDLNGDKDNQDVIIEDIAVMMGDPADLCATVRTRGDQRIIFDFVTAKVRPIPGIQKTSTCIEAWSASRDRVAKQVLAEQTTKRKKVSRPKKAPKKKSAAAGLPLPPSPSVSTNG